MRNFVEIAVEQGTPEWFHARLGLHTGSRAGDMLAVRKDGKPSADRETLKWDLVSEILTRRPMESGFVTEAMQRGKDCEPIAFAAYEGITGTLVSRSGFLRHTVHMAGCSLDGHIGDFEGILELKCPKQATHMRYLRADTLPAEHKPQVLHNLWVTGAQWCDFVSFDDRFPENLQLFRVRVPRDEDQIAAYEAAALKFLAEVANEVEAVRTLNSIGAVLREAVGA